MSGESRGQAIVHGVARVGYNEQLTLTQFIFFLISHNECDNIEIAKLFKKEIPELKKRVVETLFLKLIRLGGRL